MPHIQAEIRYSGLKLIQHKRHYYAYYRYYKKVFYPPRIPCFCFIIQEPCSNKF